MFLIRAVPTVTFEAVVSWHSQLSDDRGAPLLLGAAVQLSVVARSQRGNWCMARQKSGRRHPSHGPGSRRSVQARTRLGREEGEYDQRPEHSTQRTLTPPQRAGGCFGRKTTELSVNDRTAVKPRDVTAVPVGSDAVPAALVVVRKADGARIARTTG